MITEQDVTLRDNQTTTNTLRLKKDLEGNDNYKAMLSLLISAMSTGMQVSFYVDYDSAESFWHITRVRIRNKS